MTARRAPRSAWPLSIGISALLGDDSLDCTEVCREVGTGEVIVRDPAVTFDAPLSRLGVSANEQSAYVFMADIHHGIAADLGLPIYWQAH
jgi:hypothetical protein